MTVAETIESLQKLPQNLTVAVQKQYTRSCCGAEMCDCGYSDPYYYTTDCFDISVSLDGKEVVFA